MNAAIWERLPMTRTVMPTPDDPRPDMRALLAGAQLDLEEQALRDFLRGEYVPTAPLEASSCPPPQRQEEPGPVVPSNEPAATDHPPVTA